MRSALVLGGRGENPHGLENTENSPHGRQRPGETGECPEFSVSRSRNSPLCLSARGLRPGLLGAVLVAVMAAGCSESPMTPTAPSESPFVTQFTGMWNGAMQLQSVSGGECVGADLRAAASTASPDVGTVAITQDGSDVTAIVRSASTGLTCRYRGTASLANFALSAEDCTAEIVLQCSTGAARVLEPIGSTMTVAQSGGTSTGIVTTTYNVFSDSTEELARKPVAGLTTQHQFTATRTGR